MKKVIVVMCIAVVTLALNFYTYANAKKSEENVIFYASYDESIDADFSSNSDIKAIVKKGEMDRKKGYKGEGLYLGENSEIHYEIKGFNSEKGSLSFWIKPEWETDDKTKFTFFSYFFDSEWRQSMVFYKAYVGEKANFMQYRVMLVSNKPINKQDKNPLPVNEWSFIVLTWNNKTGMKLYINGKISSSFDGDWEMPEQTKAKQFLMNHDDGKSAILDEYKIYNKDLTEDEIIMEYSN